MKQPMNSTITLRGLTTVSFFAEDHEAAKQWYTTLLGSAPYLQSPGYAQFRIGDYPHQLGIIDNKFAPKSSINNYGGAIIYWHVDDIAATISMLLAAGAKEYEPVIQRGESFATASVIDPFGNILGVMYNPHYLEIIGSKEK